MNESDVEKMTAGVMITLAIIGLCLFASWLTKHSIANACQNVGAFRSDGTTYECVERAPSQD